MKRLTLFKIAAVAAVLIASVLLFSGCGASVKTEMSFDKEFKGERVITATLDSDEISEIKGGFEALVSEIDANIPDALTFESESSEDGKSGVVIFRLAFDGLDDYRDKVSSLLNASLSEDEEERVPVIRFEPNDSYFKKGLYYSEDFNSADLLDWLIDALKADEIVNHSSVSDWYSLDGSVIFYGGEEFSGLGSKMSVDKVTENCLSDLRVNTGFRLDGSFERTIALKAYSDTIKTFENDNGITLSAYLSGLAPAGVKFAEMTEENSSYTEYSFTFSGTSEEISAVTNTLLGREDCVFEVEYDFETETPGSVAYTVREALDASSYLRIGKSPESTLRLYPGTTAAEYDSWVSDDVTDYYPVNGETKTLSYLWKIPYDSAELTVSVSGKDKAWVFLSVKLPDGLTKEFAGCATEGFRALVGDGVQVDVIGSSADFTVSGTPEQLGNTLGKVFSGGDDESLYDGYFKLEIEEAEADSVFKKGYSSHLNVDMSRILGDTPISVISAAGTEITDENVGRGRVNIKLYSTGVNIVAIIVAAVIALVIIAAVALLIIFRKKIAGYFAEKKKAAAERAAAAAELQARTGAATAQTQAENNSTEEEYEELK